MKSRQAGTTLLLLALAAGFATWAYAQPTSPAKPVASGTQAAAPKDEDDEVEIKFSELPEVVRAAALKTTAEKSIKKTTRCSEEGIAIFEVEFTDNGATCSATLSSAGDVLEIERGITQDRLPAAALAALKKDYARASFGTMHLVTKTFYEVEVVLDGKTREIKVNAAGDIEDEHKHAEHDEKDENHK